MTTGANLMHHSSNDETWRKFSDVHLGVMALLPNYVLLLLLI